MVIRRWLEIGVKEANKNVQQIELLMIWICVVIKRETRKGKDDDSPPITNHLAFRFLSRAGREAGMLLLHLLY